MLRNHKRNVSGLKKAAKRKHEDCIKRLDLAIRNLLSDGKPINFNTVSKEGNLSTAWLYKNKDVRQRIEGLRSQQFTIKKKNNTATDHSKDAIILTLKNRVKEQDSEIRQLRKQIEALYAQILDNGTK